MKDHDETYLLFTEEIGISKHGIRKMACDHLLNKWMLK